MVGIRCVAAIAMALLVVMTSVAFLADDSDAVDEHGTSNHPLTGFSYDCYTLKEDSDKTYYVAVGSDVSIVSGYHKENSWSALTYYNPESVTSGYGLSFNGSKVSGTISKEGLIEVKVYHSQMGVVYTDYTLRIFAVNINPVYTITYDAGIGLVNGHQTWSEQIPEGSFASLPQAVHSSGAYTFMGWSESETADEGVSSYNATRDVTLHAVWKRNAVQINDATATVTSGQSASLPIHTSPSSAAVSIGSAGGLPVENLRIDDHDLILDMTGVDPGTYFIQLNASYTGYITGESVVTVKVPITIVKPIEYVLTEGDFFSYTPVTNPTNAEIALVSVTKDGNLVSDTGLQVNGRSIAGTFDGKGTYAITYRASLEGYVDVTNTVFVKVNERQASAPAPVMGTIAATPRATEPRVYDFVISGYANASNIIWSYEGVVFATSSPTALYEFPASGSYTVKCTLAGFDGSFVSEDVSVICLDNYHREAAWVGIPYSFIIESDDEVSIEDGAPFSVTASTVDGRTYRMIAGTPSDVFVGESFGVNLGDDSWNIHVYPRETSAPVVDFDLVLSDDGYTVVALFKGQNASFYSFDFNGDGIPEQGNAYTYDKEGRYTVVCKAVNNVSETSKSDMVSINVIPHEDVYVLELTDFQMVVGEKLDVILTVEEGDIVTVSGPAADFVTVRDGSTLRAEPTEKGVFDLKVTVHHDNGTSVSKTVKVTVRGDEVQDLVEEKHDYMVVMAIFFIISVSAIAVFILRDIKAPIGQKPSLIDRYLRRRQYR